MFYPDNFEEKIGFDIIRQLLTDHCISEMGREFIHDIQYSDSFDEIQHKLLGINEFKEILLLDAQRGSHHSAPHGSGYTHYI